MVLLQKPACSNTQSQNLPCSSAPLLRLHEDLRMQHTPEESFQLDAVHCESLIVSYRTEGMLKRQQAVLIEKYILGDTAL